MDATDTRTRIIKLCTFLGGVYFFLHFILPEEALQGIAAGIGWEIEVIHPKISLGLTVISAMALGLGVVNLIAVHGSRLVFRRPGWTNSLALLLGMVLMFGTAVASWVDTVRVSRELRAVQILGDFATLLRENRPDDKAPPYPQRISALISSSRDHQARVMAELELDGDPRLSMVNFRTDTHAALRSFADSIDQLSLLAPFVPGDVINAALSKVSVSVSSFTGSYGAYRRARQDESFVKRMYDFLFKGLFVPLGSAMFALLGVYIAAAAYRAFKVKTLESGLLMAAAVVVMLGQISFGKQIYQGLPAIRQWLLEIPNGGAFRAIYFGASVAGLMLAIRMWLSIESKSFGKGEK